MLKKLYLSLALGALSIAPSAHSSQLSLEQIEATIQDLIGHISQAKHAIVMEMHKTLTIGEKAIEHHKALLTETYEPLAQKINDVLKNIIHSEEFNKSIEEFTNYQLDQIVEKGLCYNDIGYPEIKIEYPIFKKIEDELYKAFPTLDAQTEQLFNIFYVTAANCRSHRLLLQKLDDNLNELHQALTLANEASNAVVNQ